MFLGLKSHPPMLAFKMNARHQQISADLSHSLEAEGNVGKIGREIGMWRRGVVAGVAGAFG